MCDDDTLFPKLGQGDAQARAWCSMLECLADLTRQHSLQLAGCELTAQVDANDPSFINLVRALAEAAPEPECGGAPALFDLHVVTDTHLRRAAVSAYTELPAGEATFAHRQWWALLRVITAIDQQRPGLRGDVYAYAATRAFAEYHVGGGTPLEANERQCAEAIAVVLRYVHSFFRATNPGLGEAAYTLAPLALVEHLRQMFPMVTDRRDPPKPEPTTSPPGGNPAEIH